MAEAPFSFDFPKQNDLQKSHQKRCDEVRNVSDTLQQRRSDYNKLGEECDREAAKGNWKKVFSLGNELQNAQRSIKGLMEVLRGHIEKRQNAKKLLEDHESLREAEVCRIDAMRESFQQTLEELQSVVESENCLE